MKKTKSKLTGKSSLLLLIGRYAIYVICGLFLVIGLFALNQMILYTPDCARYLIWANSLARLEGFKDATNPEVTRYVIHAPLYSLVLAPSALLFPNNVVAAKAMTLLIGCLAIFLLYTWLKRRVGERYALLGAILFAFNPVTVIFSTQILSDVPFVVCVILFFMLGEKFLGKKQPDKKMDVAMTAVIVAGIFLREVGLTLMLSATIFFLWKKQYYRAARVFMISIIFYLLWFVRNEVIVAAVENPPVRNTQFFFTHLYTPNQASLFEELGRRLSTNLNVYVGFIGKLLFMPEFGPRLYSLISPTDPFVALVFTSLSFGQFILVGITLGFLAIGVWHEIKHSKSFSLVVVFLLCYLLPILLYPVNDDRFLFPFVVVMIYLFIIGFKQSITWVRTATHSHIVRQAAIGLLILLLVPNISWLQSFVWNSWQYSQSPERLYSKYEEEQRYADLFAKPLELAAQWIVQHSDSSAVVLTRWKEVAIWLQGRKIVEINPFSILALFDYSLRDYGVKYIVATNWRAIMNEYETLFAQSKRFAFQLVYRVGNAEVYEVKQRDKIIDQMKGIRADSSFSSRYDDALHVLEDDPKKSEEILNNLAMKIGMGGPVGLHISVAKEFAGQYDSAEVLLKKFAPLPQAGSQILLAWYHQEIISRIKRAESAPSPAERARRFHIVAINYWELGYCKQAMKMLHRSLEADSSFFPSLITSALFSFQQADTASSRKYLQKAKELEPSNNLVEGLTTVIHCIDSLYKTSSRVKHQELRLKIAEANISMGIRERAIDDLLEVLRENPINTRALHLLAETYEAKRRYAPAVQMYKRIVASDSTDSSAAVKLHELSDYCQ